jgi:NAD(P)-dependent dehydrogenase (short-subunit alcohol dehydrogenase family)
LLVLLSRDSNIPFLQDKIVLVTGGAKGIGRMISEGYVTNGATVYISSRDSNACEKAVSELNALGKGRAHAIAADFYKEEDIKKLVEEFGKRESSTVCA